MEDLKSLERFLRTEEEKSHRSQLGTTWQPYKLLWLNTEIKPTKMTKTGTHLRESRDRVS